MLSPYFHPIPDNIVSQLGWPKELAYPFNYSPHPLARYASEQVQVQLAEQAQLLANPVIDGQIGEAESGKMFGVLVVKNKSGQWGYLKAFSGKLAGKNLHPGFVPPVFDNLIQGSFFLRGEAELDKLNARIKQLEELPEYLSAKEELATIIAAAKKDQEQQKAILREGKARRKQKRTAAKEQLAESQLIEFNEELDQESLEQKNKYRKSKKAWKVQIQKAEKMVLVLEAPIQKLKDQRKTQSASLQQQLFDQYNFLNSKGEVKNVREIFRQTLEGIPPAAAGDCAAPKLLQYAFHQQLTPVCMAEFWWGPSSPTQIRKQGQYYPACRGKCEPILKHMLEGLPVQENPLLENPAIGKTLPLVYEDEHLLVVNKPTDFLSVPGKNISDSVYERMKLLYPEATGPLIVHRLDMSTSGILLIAKNKEIHQALQAQFIKRRVEKRYVALLDGVVRGEEGVIKLPLRVDLDNRPQQMVCFEYGKKAKTQWRVLSRSSGQTRVHFFPVTGRTHQLRVHAAHSSGLNAPIVGDELYGTRADHLHLHAESLKFWHPVKKEWIRVEAAAPF